MKINEVEQKVGITKKNIRFYEDQGLLLPARNTNGYREYSEDDLKLLYKIKLLRRLAIPIDEIRRIQEGRLTLSDCMERHQIILKHEENNLAIMQEMCRRLSDDNVDFSGLQPEEYLEQIASYEKEGNRFMNVEKTDIRKKKRGAAIAAAVIIAPIAMWFMGFLLMSIADDVPLLVLLLGSIVPIVIVAGVVLALRERIKEINGGEEDEASYY